MYYYSCLLNPSCLSVLRGILNIHFKSSLKSVEGLKLQQSQLRSLCSVQPARISQPQYCVFTQNRGSRFEAPVHILLAITGLCTVYSAQLSVTFLLTSAAFPSVEQWKRSDSSKVVPCRPLCLHPPMSDCQRHVSICRNKSQCTSNEILLSNTEMFEIFTRGVDVKYYNHFCMIFNLIVLIIPVGSPFRIRYLNWRSLPIKIFQYNADKICSHNKAQKLELSVLILVRNVKISQYYCIKEYIIAWIML